MRNKTNLIVFPLFLMILLTAWKPSGPVVAEGGPQISFAETDYDFGVLKPGDEAVHYFVFSNSGEAPLVIVNVRASCGCMASAWTKKPVEAGSRDSIRVEYNTRIRGTFSKTITVQSNAALTSVDLKIRGDVLKK